MRWLNAVSDARKRGSFSEAMSILEEELGKRPDDGLVHYQIAWTHDALGKEANAVSSYLKAISLGLPEADLQGAYLGLGSTYRCLGDYNNSLKIFETAIALFPQNNSFHVFKSLTLYNLGKPEESVRILIEKLVSTTSDDEIKKYSRALLFYSDKLNQKFE